MHSLVAAVGLELTKRAADGGVAGNVSGFWIFLIALLNVAIFVPLSVFVLYTFGGVLPTLAMIEDPHASSRYVELSPSLDDDDDEDDEHAEFENAGVRNNKPRNNGAQGSPSSTPDEGVVITSSVRATLRQLYRLGGWRALFRGLFCAWVVSVATAMVGALVSTVPTVPFVPFLVGTLVANLALVQLHTAWVHIVVSTRPVSLAFWRRMPAFRRTFDATKYVVLVQWLATTLTQYLPFGVAWLVGVPQAALNLYNPNPTDDDSEPNGGGQLQPISAWKHIAILATVIVCILFIQVPAAVALVRVQASILPPEEDTVVPFDRSFGGTVEPAVINGSASVSIPNALRTFSRDSWVRLYKLMAKVIALTFALFMLIAAVIVPQTVLISRNR
ncbi:hypothetical protein MAPG_01755 [Magnaporthiopsis poae ATCC 64411]|uniref:Ubiquitin carrier protein n=1 Tax=Magnaporthiopsis poae (strain ATCC 64411 / 73-15) TaxID=644358 RepID=A0A0C4DPI8_MAGP6|nr:hypothetical protein MAPG_01755 [Magnaporthiopsis poae ATCC 64411]